MRLCSAVRSPSSGTRSRKKRNISHRPPVNRRGSVVYLRRSNGRRASACQVNWPESKCESPRNCSPSRWWLLDSPQPQSLPQGFHGAEVVVGLDPTDCFVRRQAVEDRKGGKGGSCSADAPTAGDFDPFSGSCSAVGIAQGVERIGAV